MDYAAQYPSQWSQTTPRDSTANEQAAATRFHHNLYSVFSSCPPCTIATFLLCPCEMILNANRSMVTLAAPSRARNCARAIELATKERETRAEQLDERWS